MLCQGGEFDFDGILFSTSTTASHLSFFGKPMSAIATCRGRVEEKMKKIFFDTLTTPTSFGTGPWAQEFWIPSLQRYLGIRKSLCSGQPGQHVL